MRLSKVNVPLNELVRTLPMSTSTDHHASLLKLLTVPWQLQTQSQQLLFPLAVWALSDKVDHPSDEVDHPSDEPPPVAQLVDMLADVTIAQRTYKMLSSQTVASA